jgi:hypothetical protein
MKIEVRVKTGWRQMAWPDDEAEALQMFQRTLRDYPTDYFVRIVRDDGSVQIMQPALGPAADRA